VLTVPIQNVLGKQEVLKNDGQGTIYYSVKKQITSCIVPKGDLFIGLAQPTQRLIPFF
jgi:hypothetical protein